MACAQAVTMVVIEAGCTGDHKEDEEDRTVVSTSASRNRRRRVENWTYIPRLPDDIAMEVLCRLPPRSHALLQGVCRKWKDVVNSTLLYEQRKERGTTVHFLCLLQAASQVDLKQHPVYNVSLLQLGQRSDWERLPPIPEYRDLGLPLFCKFAAVKGRLVVVGGWNPATWETLRSVYVFNFSTWTWRRASDMLSTRSFFACASVDDFVFVAGGHDNTKRVLPSAERYNIQSDSWEVLPRMHEYRDECMEAVMGGKFYAISGYPRLMHCQHVTSAEVYDPLKRSWSRIENLLNVGPCVVVSAAERLYAVRDQELLSYRSNDNTWRLLDKLPEGDEGISAALCMTSFGSSLVLTGATHDDEEKCKTLLYRLPIETVSKGGSVCNKGIWEALTVNARFLGITQASCVVEV